MSIPQGMGGRGSGAFTGYINSIKHGLQKHKEMMRVIEVSKAQGNGTEVEGGGNCHISGYTNSIRE